MKSKKKMLSAKKAVTGKKLSFVDLMKFEDNDFGNAQRFLKFTNGKALYDPASSNWFLYDSGRWKPDNNRKENAHKLANDLYCFLLDGLKKEYRGLESYGFDILNGNSRDIDETDLDENRLDEIHAQLKQCIRERQVVKKLGNGPTQNRMLKSAEAQTVNKVIKLNPYNHYLVVANGTVDLRTGELLDHSQEHFSTMRVPVTYKQDAEKPVRFLQFLDEIFDGNVDLINYVHRLLGYCLTGETKEHEFYILHGSGGNGKSVLLNLIKDILSEYCGEASAGALAHSVDGDKPNPTLLQAKDCRLFITNESEKNARLNIDLIKQISAGDGISPRAMFKENVHLTPHMKLLWITNHIPRLDWNDHAIERRFRLIPFTVIIPEEKRDKDLLSKLLEEREGVLKWLVDGAVSYYKDGIADIPEVMQEAMDHERFGGDSVKEFFTKMVVSSGNANNLYKSSRIYEVYRQFCKQIGVAPETVTHFGRRFFELCKAKSIIRKKHNGGNYYHGLELLFGDENVTDVA